MTYVPDNQLEVAPQSAVRAAARDFATALAETPEFRAFEQAYERLSQDTGAQQALAVYQTKVESLRALLMLNAVSDAERAELEQLKHDYLSRATVLAYAAADAELTALCQATAGMISAAIGLNYAAACGVSCCG